MTSRVAGATKTPSARFKAFKSPSQSVMTSAWEAHRTARGVMMRWAEGVMITVSSAPSRRSARARRTVSTAAIPPVTPNTTAFPSRAEPVRTTSVSRSAMHRPRAFLSRHLRFSLAGKTNGSKARPRSQNRVSRPSRRDGDGGFCTLRLLRRGPHRSRSSRNRFCCARGCGYRRLSHLHHLGCAWVLPIFSRRNGFLVAALLLAYSVYAGYRSRRSWAYWPAVGVLFAASIMFAFLAFLNLLQSLMSGEFILLVFTFLMGWAALGSGRRAVFHWHPVYRSGYHNTNPLTTFDLHDGEMLAACPSCLAVLAIRPAMLGQADKCPHCGNGLVSKELLARHGGEEE